MQCPVRCCSVALTLCFAIVFVAAAVCAQAHPQDPDNFPFMTLGNKIDVDGGNSRVVSTSGGALLPAGCLDAESGVGKQC